MKKETIYAIFATAAVMLSCTACGGQTDSADIGEPEITSDSDKRDPQETNLDTSDSSASQTENLQTNDAPEKTGDTQPTDDSASGQDNTDEQQRYSVTLDWQTIENSDTAEDGTLLYTSTCTYPIISIEGNQAAADNINASIQGYVTAFHSDTSIQSFARENYVPENPAFITYNSDLIFAARRSDSNVISFEAVFYAYSGGAHGNYGTVGLNYDTRTGEPIGFTELGEDADSFRADTFAFNRALADTPAYQEKMYDGSPSDEQLEAVLYAEDAWFLSTSGLTFISNPYALGPYAAGAIEFTIPYDELEKMGLKKEYRYDGNLTIKLLDNIPASADLNGDKNEETILYYTEYDGSPDAETEYVTHFLINGIDVASGVNDELHQLLIDFPWSQCVLYDMNPSDDMIEFVVITTEYPDDSDDALLTSHFFRYEKDGSVSFLGTMDGGVLDPTALLSVTAPLQVSIDWQILEREESAEDGTLYYTSDCIYPVVSIEGNQAAADKINADIQDRVNSFQNSYTADAESAREHYERFGGFGGIDNLTYQAARSDDQVISFLITYFGYAGGAAHGNYGNIGINYDARTGEPIDFAELAQDSGQFYADTFAFNREFAATEAYREILLPADMPDERLESVLYQEDSWILAADGLTFIGSPYALASFADGTITFVIPYEELEKMGLKPEYQYPGNLTVTLWEKLVYAIDLNGDGKEDSIQFYEGYEKDAHGNFSYRIHLIINDTDVIQEELRHGNEILDRLFADSYWTTCALYDLNPFDDTIEIAIMTASGDHDEGEIPAFTSHLFRCKTDGLAYIGRMNDAVSVLGTL